MSKCQKANFSIWGTTDNSTDSREVGFCDKTYVVGRTEIIVYNYNFVNRLWEVVKFYFKEMETFFAR